jgi:hypothetical protein
MSPLQGADARPDALQVETAVRLEMRWDVPASVTA